MPHCLSGIGLLALATSAAAAADLSEDEQRQGFVSLCDGESLAGWTGAVAGYTVEGGIIACQPETGGNLFTEREYADFTLRFEFQLTEGSNNGIGLRVPAGGHASYDGMEIQILDNAAARYAKLQPYQYHGSVYGIIPAKRGYLKPVGAWNTQEIRCIGRRVTVILNGETIVDGDLDKASAGGTLDHKEHPGLARTSGHIVLCGHKSDVKFRRLRVREVVQ
jgi:hypothetical protein